MAVLKVNGAEIRSPSELKVTVFEVGSGEVRSASGGLVTDCVAVKRKLSLKWATMEPAELGALLGAVSGEVFTAEYPDPKEGTRTAVFHCGETLTGVLRIVGGAPVWVDISMEWTEK